METENTSKPLVLIFTMQKCGSSTMMNAIRAIGWNPGRGYEANQNDLGDLDSYEKVITLVRDPVARNLSWFFELFGDTLEELSFDEVYLKFKGTLYHEYPLEWFENVFEPLFGIDVFDRRRFAKSRGWSIIEGRYLIIRTENLNQTKAAFKTFFGVSPTSFKLGGDTALTRSYGEYYRKFINWVKFDKKYLDRMYQSKYMKHFYSQEEIKGFYKKWINN